MTGYQAQVLTDMTPDIIEGYLTYHLPNGGCPTISFEQEPPFVPTALTNSSYANVTGGQRVGIMTTNEQAPVVSGNKTVTNIDTPVMQ
jgi:transforming growth factor-beta-induced protein